MTEHRARTLFARIKRLRYPLIALLILGFGAHWLFSDVNRALERRERNVEQLKAELARKRQLAATLPEQRRQLDEMRGDLEELAARLPDDPDLDALTQELIAAAQATGAELVHITPQPLQTFEFYEQQTVLVKLQGSYAQIGELVDRLSNSSQIYRWASLTMVPDTKNQTLVVTGELATYGILDEAERKARQSNDKPERR